VGNVRVGSWSIGLASVTLVSLLVVSAGIAVVLIRSEIRAGGMEDKWVLHDVDAYGNEQMVSLLFVNSQGGIIGSEDWNNPPCFVAISPEGAVLWRSPINARPYPEEGPDGRYYYVDWADSDSGPWSNLTSLSPLGSFRWSYVVSNGTLDLWAIYPDGVVIAHHYFNELNQTTPLWETIIDRVFAISRKGVELWSVDMPFDDASWGNPSISNNGTFVVHTRQADGTYEFGISKYGTESYLQKGQYMTGYMEPSGSTYGGMDFEVRKEAVDAQTTVTSVYAFDTEDGSLVWKTVLGYADNPDNMTPGGGWQLEFALADVHGRIFCDEMNSGHTYSLDLNGTILWKKPYLGALVDLFPSGGILVLDDSSFKRIDPDGLLVWRHFAKTDGYTRILIGGDDTVYYNYKAGVHALVSSTSTSTNVTYLEIIAVVDVVAIGAYGLVRMIRARKAPTP
jgi:hypothetical protein